MKIALVHDYLYTYGGAERVLEVLHQIWPAAPIYTAWVDWPWLKKMSPNQLTIVTQKGDIFPSWFDKLPFKKQLCSPLRFLAPKIWSSFDLSRFEVVISSSAWYMSKGVSLSKTKKTMHICYCHTPPRYLYGYPTALNFKKYWWGRLYANLINPLMRVYDFKSSQKIDYFISNSREVARRIEKFYRRKAKIIYPPILTKNPPHRQAGRQKTRKKYYLMVNRLVKPKNIDLAIKACQKLKADLKIVGVGPAEKELRKIAAGCPQIKFLGYVSDQRLADLYRQCRAVLYLAAEEDFGLTPVEAMSFGKPVICFRSGGVKESVLAGKTGLFINRLQVEELLRAMGKLRRLKIKKEACLEQASRFSSARFKKQIKEFVEQKFLKWQNKR